MGTVYVNIETVWQDHPPGDGTSGYYLRLHRSAGAGAIDASHILATTEGDRQDWRDLAVTGGTAWAAAITALVGATTWGILDSDERGRIRGAVQRSA